MKWMGDIIKEGYFLLHARMLGFYSFLKLSPSDPTLIRVQSIVGSSDGWRDPWSASLYGTTHTSTATTYILPTLCQGGKSARGGQGSNPSEKGSWSWRRRGNSTTQRWMYTYPHKILEKILPQYLKHIRTPRYWFEAGTMRCFVHSDHVL